MKPVSKLLLLLITFILIGCTEDGPQAIKFGKDQCDHCQMTITDEAYAAELITEKGRVYKFDDLSCMLGYQDEHSDKMQNAKLYVSDFPTKQLISIEKATFITGGELKSPMGGNAAAFSDAKKAKEYADEIGASVAQGVPTESGEHQGHDHHGHGHSHEGHSH